MFAIELIQGIKIKQLFFTLFVAAITSLFFYLADYYLPPTPLLIISLFFLVAGMNICVDMLKRFGIATIFMFFVAMFTFNLAELGLFNWNKVITYVIAIIIFEVIHLIFKIELSSLHLDIIIGTTISFTSMFLVSAMLLSQTVLLVFSSELINLLILTFSTSIVSSTIFALIWGKLSTTKKIIKFEAYLASFGR
ncbi:hypothetical protein HOE37_00890 [Candidatus Woesearchaeota archaeon]|jgi:hypothetical protein|nr:hypothetical protein [Candidatus Woesearchaeota archaeon]MBT4110392.1 hypothetical protein [Candidatus Woesearchaeota archaeon]MBT4336084.1 hypothetical protein [Candidatus Woesearchaeota archaeon]MBT4468937.1 hypothetical protein [Candidatus Woesearchaeota archaeon]MBT6744744.1 hypothetical protein [Candidatus Woesearchaeota archaeon]